MERPKSPIKIVVYGGHPKMWENGFLAKIAWHSDTICVGKGEKARIFVHTLCFGQKMFWAQNSANQEKL